MLQDVEAVDDVGRPGFEPWASAVIIKSTIYHCPRLMGGVGGTPLLMVIVLQPRSTCHAARLAVERYICLWGPFDGMYLHL